MKWIQIGTAKSGNYWIYNLLQSVAKHAGLNRTSFIQNQPIHPISKAWKMAFPNQQDIDHLSIIPNGCIYNIGNIFNMPLDDKDLDDYVRQTSHVWLHSPYCNRSNTVLPKFEKLLYIIRDPRDILVSLSRYAFTPYRMKHFRTSETNPENYIKNHLEEIVLSWLNHTIGYLKHGKRLGIYFVFYERLLTDFETELKLMLDYLDVPLSDKYIQEIKKEVAFDTMKKKSSDHLRKGEYGRWTEVLPTAQTKRVAQLVGPLLELFGYALTKKEQSSCPLPLLPKEISAQKLEQILVRGNRLGKLFKTKKLVARVKTKLTSWIRV